MKNLRSPKTKKTRIKKELYCTPYIQKHMLHFCKLYHTKQITNVIQHEKLKKKNY